MKISTRVDFYDIVGRAVRSLGKCTFAERNEVYSCAREIVKNYDFSGDKGAVYTGGSNLEKLERAVEKLENEQLSKQSQVTVPISLPSPLSQDDLARDDQSHARTTQFLKNIGTGGTVSVVKIFIQIVMLPLMAHLLGPKEFGIYALAVPVVMFLAVIADGGVGLSLARDRTNSPDIWSTAFWVMLGSGIVMAVVVMIFGYILSLASSEPQLVPLMLILALSFPFLSLAVLPIARLTRSGNLVACAIADFISTMAGAICAVTLGLMGFGAKSLAYQFMAIYVVRAIILNIYAFERPKAIFRPSAMLSHLSSGGILMGGRVTDLLCRSGESLIFGTAFGAVSLGAYNFAHQVPRFLFEAFSNPSWSALYAQSLSEQPERLLQIYYKVCRLMAFVTFPAASVLAAASPEILAQVLGPSWAQAGVFLQILAPGYALSITASMGTAVLLALNANFIFFLTVAFLGVGRIISVSAGYYLPSWQCIWLVTIFNLFYAAVTCSFVVKVTGAKFTSIIKETVGSFISALVSGIACWSILKIYGGGVFPLSVSIIAAVICYFTAIITVEGKNIKTEIAFLKSTINGMIKKS